MRARIERLATALVAAACVFVFAAPEALPSPHPFNRPLGVDPEEPTVPDIQVPLTPPVLAAAGSGIQSHGILQGAVGHCGACSRGLCSERHPRNPNGPHAAFVALALSLLSIP